MYRGYVAGCQCRLSSTIRACCKTFVLKTTCNCGVVHSCTHACFSTSGCMSVPQVFLFLRLGKCQHVAHECMGSEWAWARGHTCVVLTASPCFSLCCSQGIFLLPIKGYNTSEFCPVLVGECMEQTYTGGASLVGTKQVGLQALPHAEPRGSQYVWGEGAECRTRSDAMQELGMRRWRTAQKMACRCCRAHSQVCWSTDELLSVCYSTEGICMQK